MRLTRYNPFDLDDFAAPMRLFHDSVNRIFSESATTRPWTPSVDIKETEDGVEICRSGRKVKATDITTLTYPGFPTDLQAQVMSLVTISEGISVITEKIYPERFIHISELNRMGADIILEGSTAIIKGVKKLSGAPVMASDLRASAALVLAGLVAEGCTEISRIYHLDRGYEHIEDKLRKVGANVKRVKE